MIATIVWPAGVAVSQVLPPPPSNHMAGGGEALIGLVLTAALFIVLAAAIFGVLFLVLALLTGGKASRHSGWLLAPAMLGAGGAVYAGWALISPVLRWTSGAFFNVLLILTGLAVLFGGALLAREYWRTATAAALFGATALLMYAYFHWDGAWSLGAGASVGAAALWALSVVLPKRKRHWNA